VNKIIIKESQFKTLVREQSDEIEKCAEKLRLDHTYDVVRTDSKVGRNDQCRSRPKMVSLIDILNTKNIDFTVKHISGYGCVVVIAGTEQVAGRDKVTISMYEDGNLVITIVNDNYSSEDADQADVGGWKLLFTGKWTDLDKDWNAKWYGDYANGKMNKKESYPLWDEQGDKLTGFPNNTYQDDIIKSGEMLEKGLNKNSYVDSAGNATRNLADLIKDIQP